MSQDKRRSRSYRSFVTCDHPKGVVECGTIRKNMVIAPQKKEENIKFEGEKMKVEKKEMRKGEITRELNTSSSFQLLQVSKGANKLNHVINSWSKSTNNIKNHQNEIARDLLKGALDLQESLAVLRKLQEGSNCAPRLMRKHKQKLECEGRFDGMVKGRMDERLYVEFQKSSCVSIDGLPRKSFDEMRKVVRDSLLRQNVITNPIFEEHFEHRKFDYSPDIPSTSSSQLSMIRSSNYAPYSDTSISSSVSQRKNSKGSNLIVKLMGLESFPSSPRKHKEADRIVNMEKPVYDIDSPRARKCQSGGVEIGTRQRSVDEILETLNFKGLLRSSSGHGMMANSPPIVLIKPMKFPSSSPDNVEDNCASSRVKGTLMKLRSRRAMSQSLPSEIWKDDEGEVDFEARSKYIKKVAASEIRSSFDSLQKLRRKKAAVKKAGEVGEGDPNRIKVDEKKAAKSSQGMKSRDPKKQKSGNDQKLLSKSRSSFEQKNTSTAILYRGTCQSVEGSGQRVKTRQPALTGRRGRHRDERKERVNAVKKEIDSTTENDPVFPTADHFHLEMQAEPSQIQITDYDDQSSVSDTREAATYPHNDDNSSVCDEKLIRAYEDNSGYRLHLDDNKSSASDITSLSIPELGHLNESHITIPEVTLVTTHENGVAVILNTVDEGSDISHSSTRLEDHIESDHETRTKFIDPRTKLKALLLSSPSFVNRAEELFGLQLNISLVPCANEVELSNSTLLLDCANEVMEFKSFQLSQSYLPLPKTCAIINPRTISLDQLLEEICDGVDELRCYLMPTNDGNFSPDNLYILQDRDLKFKSATWDIGWRDVFSKEDVEKVIGDIDKLILGKLVEEAIVDLML